MGSRLVRFAFTPEKNEQLEALVKLPEEPRSIIHGIVKNHNNKLVKDAVVKLFELRNPSNPCSLKPITHTFTDECGQFLFGPLIPNKQYVIKVWVNDIKIRQIVINPENYNSSESDDFEDEEI